MQQAAISAEASLVVRALVLYSAAEAQAGHASTIEVQADGDEFLVADNGRGHAIDRTIDGTSYLSFIYQQMAFPFTLSEPGQIQLQGIGMSLVNRLCSTLQVRVCRAGQQLESVYRAGDLISQTRSPTAEGASGIRISGRVTRPSGLSEATALELASWLAQVQPCIRGLSITYNGQPVVDPGGA